MVIQRDYDYVVIGSGFGGAVSALRLAEKGYQVLVVEKGKRFYSKDYPKTNWHIKKWIWLPLLRCFGIMKLTLFRHVSILSGTGVGGGSLVYANTLPVPRKEFFNNGNWKGLCNWQKELQPFYKTAQRMLGAVKSPELFDSDQALQQLAIMNNMQQHFQSPDVAVFFGKPDVEVADPYFENRGPQRSGCNFCGGCMTGCRYDAKNTLDKNYLYLAERAGVKIIAEQEVFDVQPLIDKSGKDGYRITYKSVTGFFKKKTAVTAKGVIFSGGVLGSIKLLFKLKKRSLPLLSDMLGKDIRTNNESLISVTTLDNNKDFSKGIAIGSILHTDNNSHLEIVRYAKGSGFWRLSHLPLVTGRWLLLRLLRIAKELLSHPLIYFRMYILRDWAKSTAILLFMQTVDNTLQFKLSRFGNLKSFLSGGDKPGTYIPQAYELAKQYASIVNGKASVFFSESLFGIPSTAHILGGAVMAEDAAHGVIDADNNVFGYSNMLICDGSMISANPGVNPALTITAITERAMSKIPVKP